MPFTVYRTTAEDIVGATDAALQAQEGVDEVLVSNFLDIPTDNARNALGMAEQLGLVSTNPAGQFFPTFPYAVYLVTGVLSHKAAILRLALEQYIPYKTFKSRLRLTDSAQEASNQTRALFGINLHRNEIMSTFVSLGTYTNSIVAEGAGRYRVSENESQDFLSVVNEVIQNRETAEICVRRRIGVEAEGWINYEHVLQPLVTAYQMAASAENEPRTPIVYAGNAIESFLEQVADHYAVNVAGANGINAKADRIAQAHHLAVKHKFMVKYLGHVRNAADHGIDGEIGQAWSISEKTAVEYVHVAQSVIADIVAYINNRFVV